MSISKSVADLLGDFLIALAGEDRVAIGRTGEELRRALPVPPHGDRGPGIGGLSAMTAMLRHYELAAQANGTCLISSARHADATAYAAARTALEARLEDILAGMRRVGQPTMAPSKLGIGLEEAFLSLSRYGTVKIETDPALRRDVLVFDGRRLEIKSVGGGSVVDAGALAEVESAAREAAATAPAVDREIGEAAHG